MKEGLSQPSLSKTPELSSIKEQAKKNTRFHNLFDYQFINLDVNDKSFPAIIHFLFILDFAHSITWDGAFFCDSSFVMYSMYRST
ncbi:MAG: hypothetical protein U5L72_03240 [Bacteroidales bacterium]|nr:hypothetical protein [Bacteroidales bacterium]